MTEQPQSYGPIFLTGVFSLLAGALGGGGIGIWLGDRIWPQNHPPQAELQVTPTVGPAPLEVTLNGAASHDPDGDDLEYSWTVDLNEVPIDKPALPYTFNQAKQYVVTLEVRDSNKLLDRAAATVTVNTSFDLSEHLRQVDDISRLIASGEYLTALETANFLLRTCDVAPPERCAEIYMLIAEASRYLDRLIEARIAMANVVELQPDDLTYSIDFAGFLIMLNQHAEADAELDRISAKYPSASQPTYFSAILKALAQDYASARTGFESVVQASPAHGKRAKFGALLVGLLDGTGTRNPALASELQTLACADAELAEIASDGAFLRQPDLFCFRRLAELLDPTGRDWLREKLRGIGCG